MTFSILGAVGMDRGLQAHARRVAVRCRVQSVLLVLAASLIFTILCESINLFVPGPHGAQQRSIYSHAATLRLAAQAGEKEAAQTDPEYKPYDWENVANAPGTISLDELPDLPDLAEEEIPGQPGVQALSAKVKEVAIPDLPGDSDLLPPEPVAFSGGFGLWEWTGIWIVGGLVLALIGLLGSEAVYRAKLEPAFASDALSFAKVFFTVAQGLFLARVLLTQFPKTDTTEMPWALVHYPTEWVLGPTRAVFKPEAGVDIAPILWLMVMLLGSELLTGPAGILTLAKNGPPSSMSAAFTIR